VYGDHHRYLFLGDSFAVADAASSVLALGYELNRSGAPMLGEGSFGHSGGGGRLGFAHPRERHGR
jgi:hypothetical protein